MIQILTRDDLLKCVRNELVPENLMTCFGIKGLLQYRIMDKKDMQTLYMKAMIRVMVNIMESL